MRFLTRCMLALGYAYSAVVLGAATAGDISKVNGSIKLEDGQQAADVSTVNGSVTLGAGARADSVETVNGSVRIGDRAEVESAETVNGSVTVGADSVIRNGIDTVNGSMTLRRGARVAGGLENVNGEMVLEGAQVEGGIETVNGDIRVGSGSRVTGGIHVEENKSWFKSSHSDNPRITIEQGAVVEGRLYFEREVDLYVAPGVTLPAIEGVAPRRFELK